MFTPEFVELRDGNLSFLVHTFKFEVLKFLRRPKIYLCPQLRYPGAGPGIISVALTCTQGQTSKKVHKISISLSALKLQWLLTNGYSKSDVIGQFFVKIFFGLELVLVMIRIGGKFRL